MPDYAIVNLLEQEEQYVVVSGSGRARLLTP
jgi:hypothetical protein